MSTSFDSLPEDEGSIGGPVNCVVMLCQNQAAGLGPWSRQNMCTKHLADDGEKVRQLKREVQQKLGQYSKISLESLQEKEQRLGQEIEATTRAFANIRDALTQWESQLVQPLKDGHKDLKKCIDTRQDMLDFDREVASAEADGNLTELCKIVKGMEIDMHSLVEDFERINKLPKSCRTMGIISNGVGKLLSHTDQHLTRLQESTTSGDGSADAMMNNGEPASAPSSVVQLDNLALWVAACQDASGFLADNSGRVVKADSAKGIAGSSPLPQPVLFVALQGSHVDHLVVTSLDGEKQFKCHCPVNFGVWIFGLHCIGKKLFIAQKEAVTVTDLSGQVVHKIPSNQLGNDLGISGIGGDATRVFVTGGDVIAEVNVQAGKLESEHIKLGLDAPSHLGNLTVTSGGNILVRDHTRHEVYKICLETRQVALKYPTPNSGFERFRCVWSVAADSRDRFFVSDGDDHVVYCMTNDGSVVKVLGRSATGNGDKRLFSYPYGLTVTRTPAGAKGAGAEKLLVTDWGNKRLLVFDL